MWLCRGRCVMHAADNVMEECLYVWQDEVRRVHGIDATMDLLLTSPILPPKRAAVLLLAALAEENSCNAVAIDRCNGVRALVDTLCCSTPAGAVCRRPSKAFHLTVAMHLITSALSARLLWKKHRLGSQASNGLQWLSCTFGSSCVVLLPAPSRLTSELCCVR